MNEFVNLSGRVALVTGGSRAIGYGVATALAQVGADVCVVSRHLDEGQKAASELQKLGVKAMAVQADVGQVKEVRAMVDRVIREMGKVDILVNIAGITVRCPALDLSEADWDSVMDINLKGTFFCAQTVARHMVERGGGGKIVNTASILSKVYKGIENAYATSKGAIVQLTRVLAFEWAQHNINVNAVAPGSINVGISMGNLKDPEKLKANLARIPFHRLGTAQDIGAAVVYLVSDAASYVTGQTLYVDGGWTIA